MSGWSWLGENMPSPIEESLMKPLTSVWLRVHPVGMAVIRFLWLLTGPCFEAFSDSL